MLGAVGLGKSHETMWDVEICATVTNWEKRNERKVWQLRYEFGILQLKMLITLRCCLHRCSSPDQRTCFQERPNHPTHHPTPNPRPNAKPNHPTREPCRNWHFQFSNFWGTSGADKTSILKKKKRVIITINITINNNYCNYNLCL